MPAIIIGLVLLLGAATYLVVRFMRARSQVKALQQTHRPTHVLRRADPPVGDRVDDGEGSSDGDEAPELEPDPSQDAAPAPRPQRSDPFKRGSRSNERRGPSGLARFLRGLVVVVVVASGVILIANEARKHFMAKPVAIDPCSVCRVDKVSIDQLTCERVSEKKWQFFGHKCTGPDACATCQVGNCFSDDIDTPPSDAACNTCVTPKKGGAKVETKAENSGD